MERMVSKNNKIKLKVINQGFDILSQKFFINYNQIDDNSIYQNVKNIEFDTFEEYIKFHKRNKYLNSCYFGYTFSKEEIKKYKLDINKINNVSFIDFSIDDDSFEKLIEKYLDEREARERTRSDILDRLNSETHIETYKEFIESLNNFTKKTRRYLSPAIYFSLIIQKFGDKVKDYICKYFLNHDNYYSFTVVDIYHYYGKETLKQLVEEVKQLPNNSVYKYTINTINDFLSLIESGIYRIEKKGFCDTSSNLFYVLYVYENTELFTRNYVKKYFYSFDDFANELDGDLSTVDLSLSTLSRSEIYKYKINNKTKLPIESHYDFHIVEKKFFKDHFIVNHKWLLSDNSICFEFNRKFDLFCDFYYYLKGDLSGSDFIMCDNIINLKNYDFIDLSFTQLRSSAAEKLGLRIKTLDFNSMENTNFKNTENNELISLDTYYLQNTNNDYENQLRISYISDIHLFHKLKANKCKTAEDSKYIINKLANVIAEDKNKFLLIAGDIAFDIKLYDYFISRINGGYIKKIFITLGNHELWEFPHNSLDKIVFNYKYRLKQNNMYLVQNNLYFIKNNSVIEISAEEILNLSIDDLKNKSKLANLIIFGGIGFSGYNDFFNADSGLYRNTISREKEIEETKKFERLYYKICSAFAGRNVIILTHMPLENWCKDNYYEKGFIYLSGHDHLNKIEINEDVRIYRDNQSGYNQKFIQLKDFSINDKYDCFLDFKDGIHEINKLDYMLFNYGQNICVNFNREFKNLYLIKRNGYYLFLLKNDKGKLFLLKGGAIKKIPIQDINYYYEKLGNLAESIKSILSKYESYQKEISREVKSIGGSGHIHGCIVDIDYLNHLYINIEDGSITPYYALSMSEKYVYKNYSSLLKYRLPQLYEKYLTQKNSLNPLIPLNSNSELSKENHLIRSLTIYTISGRIKLLQYISQNNIVRFRDDNLVKDSNKNNGIELIKQLINVGDSDTE